MCSDLCRYSNAWCQERGCSLQVDTKRVNGMDNEVTWMYGQSKCIVSKLNHMTFFLLLCSILSKYWNIDDRGWIFVAAWGRQEWCSKLYYWNIDNGIITVFEVFVYHLSSFPTIVSSSKIVTIFNPQMSWFVKYIYVSFQFSIWFLSGQNATREVHANGCCQTGYIKAMKQAWKSKVRRHVLVCVVRICKVHTCTMNWNSRYGRLRYGT